MCVQRPDGRVTAWTVEGREQRLTRYCGAGSGSPQTALIEMTRRGSLRLAPIINFRNGTSRSGFGSLSWL